MFDPAKTETRDYIFLLSHMRAYTSVLSHILGSHPEIDGYAEATRSYNSPADLDGLREWVAEAYDGRQDGRYVLDKILHNHFTISDDVLRHPRVRHIFLLRKPEPTLRSIIFTMAQRNEAAVKVTAYISGFALGYYRDRLQQLEQYAQTLARPALFLEAETLFDRTPEVLAVVTDWLGLGAPLSEEYDTFKYTGAAFRGDTSPYIQTGKVVRNREKYAEDLQFAPDILDEAEQLYHRCHATLSQHCERPI